MSYKITATCPVCNKKRSLFKSFKHDIVARCRACAKPKTIGKKHIMKNGYMRTQTGNGFNYEHIYVWEKVNGKVPKGFVIHHIDHDRTNNDIENLELMTKKKHDIMTIAENTKNGVRKTFKTPNQKDFDKDLLIQLIGETKSIRQVAKILGTTKSTITRNLRDYNIKFKFDLKTHETVIV